MPGLVTSPVPFLDFLAFLAFLAVPITPMEEAPKAQGGFELLRWDFGSTHWVYNAFSPCCPLCFLFLPTPSPLQRAKIGTGSKAADEKTRNAISKLDNNGSRDRMKLSDFNFLMVLGKGSFGKVRFPCNS